MSRVTFALALLLLVLLKAFAGAETAAPVVTAGFLYNFAKFTEWPAGALTPGAPLVLCVLEEPRITRALTEITAGKTIGDHRLSVQRVDWDGSLESCHVLYIDPTQPSRAAQLAARLSGSPILAVSDAEAFSRRGGIAELFIEGGRMRFAVNIDAAGRSRLRLSSRLLGLAVIVRDTTHASTP